MWDGNFYVGKEKFFLGKCIFFFSGSSLSAEDETSKIFEKYTDLMRAAPVSRIRGKMVRHI